MTRGSSLANDLRLALNNPRYSDLKILCEDSKAGEEGEQVLYASKMILAIRSEMLDRLLYNGMKETSQDEITFPTIKLAAMQVILEFLYTGSISDGALTIDNVMESYHAADYFTLPDLQETILAFAQKIIQESDVDMAASLLSVIAQKMTSSNDNKLFKLLSKRVATTPLDSISYNQLNSSALEVLLQQTLDDKQEYFATTEYGVIRYLVLWAANQISPDAVTYFNTSLPPPNTIDQVISKSAPERGDEDEIDPQLTQYQPLIIKSLSPIIRHVDFRLIHADILANVIEPLQIVPADKLLKAYRFHSINQVLRSTKRGIPFFRWDQSAIGPNLIVSKDGTVVEASPSLGIHESARATEPISGTGNYEWDVVIEENCGYAWVGLCAAEGVNLAVFLGGQATGWVMGSSGSAYHGNMATPYGSIFDKGSTVTVHLDMTNRTVAFSIDGVRQPIAWTDIPSKVYPAVSLNAPGRFRIKPHV
ncbi:8711_t:CDS:1 [Ambispora gerdemannii]|uniref:8711_t:CDS:1 n=1 Tax=Ambispora gerdemannii TaxID=144530 RepID=A0A9N8ZA19_9GLOM|nr:8711_t:CDS:1 [Ambispora gerdemannii]